MQNLKIRVNSADESREAQGYFEDLGAVCCSGLERNKNVNFLFMESGFLTACKLQENFDKSKCKEITLPELRDMVASQHSNDEPFLTPECTLNDQYAEIEQVRQAINKSWGSVGSASGGASQSSGGVDATLAERQSTYGNFEDVAFVTENIMHILAKVRVNGLDDLPNTHRMALYMIASKMARIVNGDFNHLDSWHDIGGYAKLIEKLIKGE